MALATLAVIAALLTEARDTDLSFFCAVLIILTVGVLNAGGEAEEEERS